jgi:hypothetical protein
MQTTIPEERTGQLEQRQEVGAVVVVVDLARHGTWSATPRFMQISAPTVRCSMLPCLRERDSKQCGTAKKGEAGHDAAEDRPNDRRTTNPP